MMKKYEYIIESYKRMYPNYYNKTVDCRPSSRHSILVTMNDGSKLEYNSLDSTVRDVTRLYSTQVTEMDEEAWRREFGRKLRRVIAEKGINQEKLSDMIGISRQMLTRYVRGTSTPSGYVLSRLASVLECDAREFTKFGYIDEE